MMRSAIQQRAKYDNDRRKASRWRRAERVLAANVCADHAAAGPAGLAARLRRRWSVSLSQASAVLIAWSSSCIVFWRARIALSSATGPSQSTAMLFSA